MESPLAGRRILLTREREENTPLANALRKRGAAPLLLPAIETVGHEPENRPEVVRNWNRFRWAAFASKNGARYFRAWLDMERLPLPPHIQIAAVGSGTAKACAKAGFPPAEMPEEFTGASLSAHLVANFDPAPILLPRGVSGREELASGLSAAGWEVFPLPLYETRRAPLDDEVVAEIESGVDAALFASPSAVKSLLERLPLRARRALLASALFPIGPTTAEALRAAGGEPAAIPGEHTPEGLLRALAAYFGEKP